MGVENLKKEQLASVPPTSGLGPATVTSATSDVASMQRAVPREAWLEKLLNASCELRPGASIDESAGALIDAVRSELDDIAIGACIPGGEDGQIVVRRSKRHAKTDAPDPARLFPEYAFERVIPLPHDDGSTLHFAGDDEEKLGHGSLSAAIAERLAPMLGAAIRHSRAHARTRNQSAEVQGLKDQVIQSEKLASLGQIAAGIVHELNNPLTSIVAYSDYLRRKAERTNADPADIERLARINEAAERILRFSRDLIAYSRPATEVPAPVAIHEVIDRALVFCEHVLDQTNVMVERNFGEVRPVRGVAGQLTQVFVNLFTNAAQAMQEGGGGLLSITTEMNEHGVAITITDDGHGIDADALPRIFDPFFTTKRDGSGTGLGLSIVRNIVASHGGRIRADGRSPKGTTFHVELPLAASPRNGE